MSPVPPTERLLPAIEEVRTAADRLRRVMAASPLLYSPALSERAGVTVHLKCENANPTGSFKVRGAYNVLSEMSPAARRRGVVASSAGNHGLGLAHAARLLDVPVVVYVPSTAPAVKIDGIRRLGATVIDEAPDYDAAHLLAEAHAAREGIPFVNPCAGVALLAGQGTVALEILDARPETRTIVVPVGGGGLLGGVGAVIGALAPSVAVVGVQSEETAAMRRSLDAGTVTHVPVTPTLADGLAGQVDEIGLQIGQQCADRVLLVTEGEIAESIAWLARVHGLMVEGSGAVTVAALRHGRIAGLDGPVVAVVSGGNIDARRHEGLLAAYASSPS